MTDATADIDGLVAVMREAHGFDVSAYADSFLAASLGRRRKATSRRTGAAYLEHLREDHAEADILYRSLRIGFTEFFRDPLAFALLERTILPALAEKKVRNGGGEIRVWSAGCATGQEAWSVAILLEDLPHAGGRPVPYRVFATDIDEPDLDTARTGTYGADAVGNVRVRQLRDRFARRGESFVIVPGLRQRVHFSTHDLLDLRTSSPPASIYGEFDLVLCSNVLLYYRPDIQRRILDRVRRALTTDGCLVTGETEQQIVDGAGGFRAVAPPAAVFLRAPRGR